MPYSGTQPLQITTEGCPDGPAPKPVSGDEQVGVALVQTNQPAAPIAPETREPGWSDAFWKAGKDLSTHHKANLTGSSLNSWQGVVGLVATGALGENLAKQVPVLPMFSFLDDVSQWGATLDQTQKIETEVIGADGSVQKQTASDYLQLRDGKLSGRLNDHQSGLMQANGNLDFTQQSMGGTITSTDGQTLASSLDVDDQKFTAAYNGGQGKMQAATGVDLKHQQVDGRVTSTDGQTLSARTDINDGVVGLGYDGGKDRIAASGEINRELRSAGAQLTSSDDAVTGGSSLSVADGLQSDSFLALNQSGTVSNIEDKGRVKLGRRTGLGFDHTISEQPVPGQEKGPDKGWNAGVYHDRRTGRNELSGGIKNSVQAGVATGGEDGTAVNLTLGQRVVGKELGTVSAGFSAKPGEVQADLGVGKHQSHFKLNGTGVEADLSLPLGMGAKAPAIGGGIKLSRVNDVLSESLNETTGPDGNCLSLRTVKVSDDNLWGANVKYVDPSSGIAGKFSIEKNLKQDLSYTAPADKLASIPDISALDARITELETEKSELKHTETTAKKQLNELQAEHKKIAEKQEQPRLTHQARENKLKALDQQILAQQKKLSEAQTPEARKAREARLSEIEGLCKGLNAELAPREAQRAERVAEIDAKAAELLDDQAPEQSLAAATALPAGEKLVLHREREIGWGIEAGVQTTATGSVGRTGTARLDLSLEGLGGSKVRVSIKREFDRDIALKGQVAGMMSGDRLGEKDETKSYTLELDLATEAGKAAYIALLEPVNRLGRELPAFAEAPGLSLSLEADKLRNARELNRSVNLSGLVKGSTTLKRDFKASFDQYAHTSRYTGTATHTGLQDSQPLPVIGKLFAHEERITGANYELTSNGDQSCILSLRLEDEKVKHSEAGSYSMLYQQSMASASVPPATRSVVKTYNDGSSLNLKLELRLSRENIHVIVTAPRAKLIEVAGKIDGVNGLEARSFARQLEKSETQAVKEVDDLGLQGEQRTAHLQAARLRSVLDFIEKHGEAAAPFLQQLTGGCIDVCEASLERGGYAAKSHLPPERLEEMIKTRQDAKGTGAVAHKQVKQAEANRAQLLDAQASLQLSMAALAHDPLIGPSQKARHQLELSNLSEAVKAELEQLEHSGLLSEHASYSADDLVSPTQFQSWQKESERLKVMPDKHAQRQFQSELEAACGYLDETIGELQSNRILPPAQRVELIQALLERRLQVEALLNHL